MFKREKQNMKMKENGNHCISFLRFAVEERCYRNAEKPLQKRKGIFSKIEVKDRIRGN